MAPQRENPKSASCAQKLQQTKRIHVIICKAGSKASVEQAEGWCWGWQATSCRGIDVYATERGDWVGAWLLAIVAACRAALGGRQQHFSNSITRQLRRVQRVQHKKQISSGKAATEAAANKLKY